MIITVCVCGAGTMGSGIAQVCAQAGFRTILYDNQEAMLDKAKLVIDENLDYLVRKEKISVEKKTEIFERIHFVHEIDKCTGYVIIEAITEKEEAKVSLFNKLAEFNNEEVIFASNTSSISITSMQDKIPHPERVAGMHFFNPAYIMKLVEVVSGGHTRESIIIALQDLCDKMGKHSVVCKDAPGFIVNRIARHYYLEPLRLVETNVASFEKIDEILEASGFKMGPFRLMDMIGMDVNLATTESLYQACGQPKRFEPSLLQTAKVHNKELGKKSGKGFYNYSPE